MPIYMDIHMIPGVGAIDVAEAHQKDVLIQQAYHCKCMTYWVDEARGVVFCLIDAPDKSTVEEMHRKAHGLIPNKIIDVKNEVVESFLGRINDPENSEITDQGLKVFSDSAFRILLITEVSDTVLLRHSLGAEKAGELLKRHNDIIRKELSIHGGREVENAGQGFIVSFTSAAKAVACALEIRRKLSKEERGLAGFKMAVSAGEPVSKSDRLFGDAIRMARRLCTLVNHDQVILASSVKDLLARDYAIIEQNNVLCLLPQDESLMEQIFNQLDINWQDPGFAVLQFCKKMSMSKSQLYRKTTAFWGVSPNQLIREFRLEKARRNLRGQFNNIAQTTFDSGFTSPSYFTKCFKKKYGLLPANYQHSLQ
jgi:AraC-like DNA-binding protein